MAINYSPQLRQRFEAAMNQHTPLSTNGTRLAQQVANALGHPERGGAQYPVIRSHTEDEHLIVRSGVATQPHFAYLRLVCEAAGLTVVKNDQHELIITGGF